ncbi:MAG: hypothetical protein JO147_01680 [Actinobacteria bacterium]|nr:hypothetical protein [Actinomycetota bacterium]
MRKRAHSAGVRPPTPRDPELVVVTGLLVVGVLLVMLVVLAGSLIHAH